MTIQARIKRVLLNLFRFYQHNIMKRGGFITTETARAYVRGSLVNDIPQHPGPGWTRFICISDNHSRTLYDMPHGDVLLHSGDISSWGYPEQVMTTLKWIQGLDYETKIIIAGNHDLCLDKDIPMTTFQGMDMDIEELATIRDYMKGEEMKAANVYYLEHESFEFTTPPGKRWIVYGSPGTPRYATGAFQYSDQEQAAALHDQIPSNTEILLTHTPPKHCLDLTKRGKEVGCRVLREKLKALKACRIHVFGHIHEDAGVDLIDTENGVRVAVNAAIARSEKPIVVDLLNQVV